MKKLMKVLLATFFAFAINSSANAGLEGVAIGVTVSGNDLDTVVTDDIDSNGTINTTKNITDSVMGISLFGERTTSLGSGKLMLTLGLEYTPVDADLEKRSTTQATIKGSGTTSSSGTNTGTASIEDHYVFYIQPGIMISDRAMIYGTYGYATADVTATWESVSSTNTTESKSMDGERVGFGIKIAKDNGLVMKFDYAETDYDPVSYTTTNNTTVKGDIDNQVFSISLGKSF